MSSYFRNNYLSLFLIVFLGVELTGADLAQAKRSSVADTNIFSQDNNGSNQLPTYVGSGGKPINQDNKPPSSDFNQFKFLSDITKDQQRAIDSYRKSADEANSNLNQQISELQEKINSASGKPPEMVMVDGKSIKATDFLRNQVNDLRNQQRDSRRLQFLAAYNVLSEKQKSDLDRIHRGELMIGETATNTGMGGKTVTSPALAVPANSNHDHAVPANAGSGRHGLFGSLKHLFSRP